MNRDLSNSALIIISSPSGGGKNSVINALMEVFPHSARLVTTTTRPMRPGEKDGVDYFFVTRSEFEKKLANGDFLEYNEYAGNLYGTEKNRLQDLLENFQLVFSQIEVNGKHALTRAGIVHKAIFLMPENFEVLRNRINRRGGLTDESIVRRLETAKQELQESSDYDLIIVNEEGKMDQTVAKIADFIRVEALDKKTGV